MAGAVEGPPQNDPPQTPEVGACYLVGPAPSGVWQQFPAHLAGYSSGGWRFLQPLAGMQVFIKSSQTTASYRSDGWELGTLSGSSLVIQGKQVVGSQAPGIEEATGGATIDGEARAAVSAILAALRHHGLISA